MSRKGLPVEYNSSHCLFLLYSKCWEFLLEIKSESSIRFLIGYKKATDWSSGHFYETFLVLNWVKFRLIIISRLLLPNRKMWNFWKTDVCGWGSYATCLPNLG